MVWIVDGDLAVPPQDDFAACWDRVVGAEVDAGPEAALARALGAEAAPSAPDLGALAILISPDPDAGWVWMRRFDAGLRAEALADILAGALEAEPAPVTAVEF